MKIQSVRGTHDLLPGSVELWQNVEETVRRLFSLYGFGEVRTPALEETELFARSIGADTDIVQKEMYTFTDSKGKPISLRPESTAPVVRAYIEHGLHHGSPLTKLYYIGPMFRRERPQKGRYRQFHQIGAEVLGSEHPAVEAEVIEMLVRLLGELGLDRFSLLVNSAGCPACRPAYIEELQAAFSPEASRYCTDCQRRITTNPLRVLDCKVAADQPLIERLPRITDHLCSECGEHFNRFRSFLDLYSIACQLSPRLVRGLDYYVRTTFEIVHEGLGPTQNAVVGGGRYDGLSELLGGPPTHGFGFALGLERLILLLSGEESLDQPYRSPPPDLFLVWLDETSFQKALQLARDLRGDGIAVVVDFEGRSLKAQMRQAGRMGASFVCIVGEQEVASQSFTVKRLEDGEQRELPAEEIAKWVSG